MLRNIFIMFILSFLLFHLGLFINENLDLWVNRSYRPRLWDLGAYVGIMCCFSPVAACILAATMVQLEKEDR